MKKQLKVGLLFVAVSLCACSTTQLSETESAAETAANVLETINTDTGGGVTLFTQAAANAALKATHNTGDQAIVDATIAEAATALKFQQAAANAGVPSSTSQVVTTAILTDPATIQIGATAAQQASSTGATVQ